MPDSFNNIFMTTENLAFSLPLIFVCVAYVYFKYVPVHIALPLLGGIFVIAQIRSQFKKQRDNKLVKLDESTIQGLIGELEADSDKDNAAAASQKAKNKVQARLALEKKAAAKQAAQSKKKGKNAEDDDNDDLDDLATFAKGATNKRKKK